MSEPDSDGDGLSLTGGLLIMATAVVIGIIATEGGDLTPQLLVDLIELFVQGLEMVEDGIPN